MNDDIEGEETLTAEVLIGDDAEAFLNSDLGRTILGIAELEAKAATEDLKSAKVTDPDRLRELQNIIWRSEKFKQWLGELVDRGRQAFHTLEHEELTNE